MSQGICIERASPADLQLLAPALASLPLLTSYGQNAEKLLRALQRAQDMGEALVVAHNADKRPLGLAWFVVRGGLGLAGYLRLLGVVPDAAGLGVGGRLLQAFEEACADAPGGQLILCNACNASALAFYQRRGYAQAGLLRAFAHPAHDELLLHKPALKRTNEPKAAAQFNAYHRR